MFQSILRYLSYLAKKSHMVYGYGTIGQCANVIPSKLRLPVDEIDICRTLAAT